MTLRTLRPLLIVMAALAATVAAPSEGGLVPTSFVAVAHGETTELPSVGSRLVAVVDVELDRAVVRAGSHVSIVGRKGREGRVMFDVALADGHVVKGVPLQRLRTSFRVA